MFEVASLSKSCPLRACGRRSPTDRDGSLSLCANETKRTHPGQDFTAFLISRGECTFIESFVSPKADELERQEDHAFACFPEGDQGTKSCVLWKVPEFRIKVGRSALGLRSPCFRWKE